MYTSAHSAIQTLLDNGIDSLPVTSKEIEKIIKRYGFKVVAYNFPLTPEWSEDFKEIGMLDAAQRFKAFTYVDNDYKIVFYRSNLSAEKRIRLLAHELGHICLGHFAAQDIRYSCGLKSPQEAEAEEFAVEFLAPTCILKKFRSLTPEKISNITGVSREDAEHIFFKVRSHTIDSMAERKLCAIFALDERGAIRNQTVNRYMIIALVVLLAVITGLGLSNNNQSISDQNIVQHTITPAPSVDVSDNVAVTKSGEKYHRPDCRHVAGRGVFTITVQDAINKGYEACKDCF